MKAIKGDAPRTPVTRVDYTPPAWLIDTAVMTLDLGPDTTCVRTSLRVRRNPESADSDAPLKLHGDGLETECVAVDGRDLAVEEYRIADGMLEVPGLEATATITTRVRIHPAGNTALEGLYQSGTSLLTQCEPEGFRKITWFGDRPDIMTTFHVRLEADRKQYPVLLGNGNLADSGSLGGNRHFAVWDDPYPKPSYLFALVAGDLGCKEDSFVTSSGKNVALKVYSEPENLGQLDHANESLKKAMAWDEERFGLEYDLDVYHIVATQDFNMGAMENKSLNIFNARYVLADEDTATDADFEGIEAVIAHEYFHNWTGNRVTCRDWFQLTLKEGLTVFRDQEFSSDMQSRAVKRIADVKDLMVRQFAEDAGPMAHPIRPERYVEINNFYTATVYEKGAEVVRMYHTLLGPDGFRRGMDLYFERHDGQAVTCDDFRAAMAEANGADLDQFERWYRQVGTPVVEVDNDYDSRAGTLDIRLTQSLPDHPDNENIGPLHIPFRLGLLTRDGESLSRPASLDGGGGELEARETHLVELREAETTIRFTGLGEKPVLSLLRGFSAPLRVQVESEDQELATLLAFDPDPRCGYRSSPKTRSWPRCWRSTPTRSRAGWPGASSPRGCSTGPSKHTAPPECKRPTGNPRRRSCWSRPGAGYSSGWRQKMATTRRWLQPCCNCPPRPSWPKTTSRSPWMPSMQRARSCGDSSPKRCPSRCAKCCSNSAPVANGVSTRPMSPRAAWPTRHSRCWSVPGTRRPPGMP